MLKDLRTPVAQLVHNTVGHGSSLPKQNITRSTSICITASVTRFLE